MNERLVSTQGWLLQKVPLANDDALLTFMSQDLGKVKVFASKLQRSKKKNAELDYFRWLELNLVRPKQNYKLSGVKTLQDYSINLKSYERMEFGFTALNLVARFCPEEKVFPEIIQLLHEHMTLESLPLPVSRVYFLTKLLWFNGILPRFDMVRGDVWVHPVTLVFTESEQVEAIPLSNIQRQTLEWIRRHDATELVLTYDKFAEHDLVILQAFLISVIENH